VIVTPIYAAGEDSIAGVSSALVSNAIRADGSVTTVIDVESLDEAADVAAQLAEEGTVVLSLGAGDSTTLPDLIADRLQQS
jgi:UDP-N-acetylmuramate--alanine ligase